MGDARLRTLAENISESYRVQDGIIKLEAKNQINKLAVIQIIETLQRLIFPGYFGETRLLAHSAEDYAEELLIQILPSLKEQIVYALRNKAPDADVETAAEWCSYEFLESLPHIRDLLRTDVEASFDGDPAAFSKDEIILSYPGIYAIMVNRLAHELYRIDVPLIPRMMTEYAHDRTGIDIHPGAVIGHHFFMDHGTGIVIGETTVIGNYVKIYQGVTLGAMSTRGGQMLHGVKRHPTIEDHVTIYSGASILGGNTVIGEGVVIGSNAFIVKSVPENTRVSVKNPELQFKASEQHPVELNQYEFWDFVI